LDYHTFIWGDGPRTTDVFTTMLAGYDAGIFIIDPPRPDRCDPSSFQPALDAVVAAAQNTGNPAFAVASLPENFDEALAVRMAAPNVVPMMGLETALGAIKAAQTGPNRGGWRPWPAVADRTLRMRDEASSKALIAGVGVAVPRSVTAATLPELTAKAVGLTAPLALKGLGFAHKTEAGAVRLGLTTLDGQAEMAGAQGYLAEEMVTGVVAELLVGLRRDPVYGATVTLGFGGVTAELLADTQTLVLPVTEGEVAQALRSLRLWPLLDGYRGRPKADVAAVVRAVMDLQAVMQARPALEEIEINPLMLTATGAVAVDAVIWEEAE
jgi:acyl-CoA synthetase (NDP forming)